MDHRIAFKRLRDGVEFHEGVPFGTREAVQECCDGLNAKHGAHLYHWPELVQIPNDPAPGLSALASELVESAQAVSP